MSPLGTGKVWFLLGRVIKIKGFAILERNMFLSLFASSLTSQIDTKSLKNRPDATHRPPGTHCDSFRLAIVAEAKFHNFCVFDLHAKNSKNQALMQKMAAGGAQPSSYFLASLAAFAPTEASGQSPASVIYIYIYLRSAQRKPEHL